MNTLGSTAVAKRSTSVRPPRDDGRFKTVADSYFGQRRSTRDFAANGGDSDNLKNHYKFHKGTTYAIGSDKDRHNSVSNATESFAPKQR